MSKTFYLGVIFCFRFSILIGKKTVNFTSSILMANATIIQCRRRTSLDKVKLFLIGGIARLVGHVQRNL